jgi:hypothetical protein
MASYYLRNKAGVNTIYDYMSIKHAPTKQTLCFYLLASVGGRRNSKRMLLTTTIDTAGNDQFNQGQSVATHHEA